MPDHAVDLDGVTGEGGDYAQGLQSFIDENGGVLTCDRRAKGGFVCTLPNAGDISRNALFNGAADATTDASADYHNLAAEAKSNRKGIWAQ